MDEGLKNQGYLLVKLNGKAKKKSLFQLLLRNSKVPHNEQTFLSGFLLN